MKLNHLILALSLWGTLCANNIAVTNVALTGKNVTDSYTLVEFDLSGENSWRISSGAANWDAAWVFVKYRSNGGEWQHASLNTDSANHTIPSGGVAEVPSDGKGVFLFRDSDGFGTFTLNDVQLRWEYGNDGVGDNDLVEVKVFAIEMVYVAQRSFDLGSGRRETRTFTDGIFRNTGSNNTTPFTISSEDQLRIDSSEGNLWARYNGNPPTNAIGDTGYLPAAYPKGYDAFYCMKYELTQSQYRDFLNTLTYTQQDRRTVSSPDDAAGTGALSSTNLHRQGIDIMTPGVASSTPAVYACNLDGDGNYNETNDGQSIACNFVGWTDAAAFLDWAALRPMTEMEFEKACRGTTNNTPNEYAWGTGSRATGVYTLTNEGTASEAISSNYSSSTGNMWYRTTEGNLGAVQGPLRVGIFAANGSSTGRASSGASYWGIMELSGNLRECAVSVADTARSYTGINGDGTLSSSGHANQTNWPGMDGGRVINAQGIGHRGGSWRDATGGCRVSVRSGAAAFAYGRARINGMRGVR